MGKTNFEKLLNGTEQPYDMEENIAQNIQEMRNILDESDDDSPTVLGIWGVIRMRINKSPDQDIGIF